MGLVVPRWKEPSCSGKLQEKADLHARRIEWEGWCSISNQISFKRSDYSLKILSHVHLVNAQGSYYQPSPRQGQWGASASVCPRRAVAPSLGTGGLARVAPAVPAPPRVLSCVTSAPSLLLVALSLLWEAQALLQQGFQCFCFVTWEGVLPSGFYSLIFHGLGWRFIKSFKKWIFCL